MRGGMHPIHRSSPRWPRNAVAAGMAEHGFDDARIGRFDHVTRLPNRVEMRAHLTQLLRGAAGSNTTPTLVLVTLADARHFNEILRALGHEFSEAFIRAGARLIAERLPAGTQLFNVSVLSFAFTLDAGGIASPQALANEIYACFAEPVRVDDIPIRTTTGIGLIDLAPGVADAAEALRAALTAAQQSRSAQQAYAHYDARSDAAHQRAFSILTDVPEALAVDDQLRLYFQPRMVLSPVQCVGAEALIRWQHPKLGWIPPGELLPLVETTALIKPLTAYVLERTVQQLSEWQDSGRGLSLSMNISPRNLIEPDFVERLEALIERYSINPCALELEFTEGAVSGDEPMMLKHLERIRALGVAVAIDDFGSGYSNMAYLTKIPADVVKIDKGFVIGIEHDPQAQFLVQRIFNLASGLGFEVVAEGTESAAACSFLRRVGCRQAQGFYFSKPVPVKALEQWLQA